MSAVFRTFLRQAEQVSGSAVYDDTFAMATAESYLSKNLESDLNYLRSQLKVITGETNWYDAPQTALSNVPDEQGMSGSFANIYIFTGMDDRNDATPTYSSTVYVANDDSLETAIGKLDAAITTADVDKEVERLPAAVNSGSAHTVPGSNGHAAGDGSDMDLYLNGQLLQSNTGTEERDYLETDTDEVTFTFSVPSNSYLTYIIRQ